ncbi:MAG: tRNA (N6-isopentenyl adenosine(37)-C2)-methylthiotransferase MiaB [Candidatus Firestonebacteria bacterium]
MSGYFYLHTMGCQMNKYDSELISGLLIKEGFKPAVSEQQADIVILNTCSVRALAAQKAYSYLGRLAKRKKKDKKLILVMSGCVAEQDGLEARDRIPGLDLVIGPSKIREIGKYLKETIRKKRGTIAVGDEGIDWKADPLIKRVSPSKAWITVSKGCNSFCSYCIVPYVRGRELSRPFEDILKEARELAAAGYSEINLLGQNVNTYGKDIPGHRDFSDLLKELASIEGRFRIFFMTSHPKDIPIKLIDTVAGSSKISPLFHLPVQSGSDRILKLMNRGYTRAGYQNNLKEIRSRVKGASITSDIIVGFPGETGEDFKETMELVSESGFDSAYTFKYSPRKGTAAAGLDDSVKQWEKEKRLEDLMALQASIGQKLNEALEGAVLEVLLDDPPYGKGGVTARTVSNKPVMLEKTGGLEAGARFVKVKITGATPFAVKGEPL